MKKTCLIVLDGWGIAPPRRGNAIASAHPRYFNNLFQENPHLLLNASGTSVGLLPGFIGNSEVGHLHIGAGRLVKQDLVKIIDCYKDCGFMKIKILTDAMKKAQSKTLHLLGLLSDGGVHSHTSHLFGLLELAKKFKVKKLFVHVITDGRDVPPKSAEKYIKELEKKLSKLNKDWKIATVTGRFYAMDRDNRWNREHKAYDVMVNAQGVKAKTALDAIKQAYKRGETDEFIQPTIVEPSGIVKSGDTIIFFNFRSDRARQITKAFVQGKFNKFKRRKLLNLNFICMTQYDPDIKAPVAFQPEEIKNSFGEIISKKNLKQFRLAETEKWAHVTYFFNGLSGKIFAREERTLIPSPKVKTYDKTPAMSAYKITKKAIEVFKSKKYAFVLINFSNSDMVGHTGDFHATVKAVKAVDECLAYVANAAQQAGFDIIVTADHGNAEQMQYKDGSPCTAHTTNKVPFIIISKQKVRWRKIKKPCLYHVAPTVLQLMDIERPKEMTKGLLR